jgi:hypothetical protein
MTIVRMKYCVLKSACIGAGVLILFCSGFGCGKSNTAMPKAPTSKIVYLVKANNELISHCACSQAIVGAPAQLDCPWCGCGWLFVCPTCRKVFTFARAEEVALTWEELAHKDLDGKWGRQPSSKEITEWISFMKILLKDLKAGKEYVYIDGWVWPTDSANLRFDGWHAHHELDRVPQFVAITNRSTLDRTLDSKEYWQSRKLANK